jgi:hypothetical protein
MLTFSHVTIRAGNYRALMTSDKAPSPDAVVFAVCKKEEVGKPIRQKITVDMFSKDPGGVVFQVSPGQHPCLSMPFPGVLSDCLCCL